jgi:hypothetical protein
VVDTFAIAIEIANELSLAGWIEDGVMNQVAQDIQLTVETNVERAQERAYDEGVQDGISRKED